MAYATHTRGFRVLTVAKRRCRWRVCFGAHDAVLTLHSATTKGGQQALVTLPGYPDLWPHCPEPVPRLIVAPALVRRVVERALAVGWQPEGRAPALAFTFRPECAHAA